MATTEATVTELVSKIERGGLHSNAVNQAAKAPQAGETEASLVEQMGLG